MKNFLHEECNNACINLCEDYSKEKIRTTSSKPLRVIKLTGFMVFAIFQIAAATTNNPLSPKTTKPFYLNETGEVSVSNFSIPPVVITGKVTDAKRSPLPGVSVKLKGSTVGTTTDANGNYSINAPDISTLIFSSIGFATQEVDVNRRTSINVTMAEDSKGLSEVVVTAFGVKRARRGLVYSSAEVSGASLTEARENNVASSLTGKIAGVDASQISSGPGGSSRVVIRGAGAINPNANNQPLYVVNGLPINSGNSGAGTNTTGLNIDRGDGISSINPDDIETITVLKSGAAAALYGSQAANGVILITTKSGKAQKGIGVEYSSNMVYGTPSAYPNFQEQYGSGIDGVKPATQAAALSAGRLSFGAKVDGSNVVQFDGVSRPYSAVSVKDNINNFYNLSRDWTNTVAFSGGSEALNFRLSVSDLNSKAQTPNSTYDRKTVNLSTRANMGKNNLINLESTIQYNIEDAKNRPGVGYAERNSSWGTYLLGNTVDVRNLAGPNGNGTDANGNEIQWNPVPAASNPYFVAYSTGNSDKTQRLIANGSVRINLLENLFIKGTVARDFAYTDLQDYVPMGTAYTPLGYLNTGQRQNDRTNFNAMMNYNTTFLKDFKVNAMVGANRERLSDLNTNLGGVNFQVPNFIHITNLATINPSTDLAPYRNRGTSGTNSVFGSADFDYKGIVYLSFTGREDTFSTLKAGNNSIFYPSVGSSVILSDIVKLPEVISFLKLRGSWAKVGSNTVSPGQINRTYSFGTSFNGVPVQNNTNTLIDFDIRPLSIYTSEGGFEVRFLKNRLSFDATYYNRVTKDDQLAPTISPTTGFLAGFTNVGKVTNKGIEILLSGTAVQSKDFSWNISLPFAYNKSKIVELAPGLTTIEVGTGISSQVRVLNAVGLPYGTIRGWGLLKDANGNQVYNKTSGYEVRVEKDLGVANPPWTMGLGNDFKYKRFSLNVLFDAKFGAVAYNNMWLYASRFGLTKATLPGRDTGVQLTGVDQTGAPFSKLWGVADVDNYYNNLGNTISEISTFSTDFVKLRQVIFNYNIPTKKLNAIGIQSATIGIVGRNLAILYRDKKTKEAGLDPEMQQSVGNATGTAGAGEPRTRTIGLNLNIKF
jgi:TonB-linked SusC/RagA family outer membrane protein